MRYSEYKKRILKKSISDITKSRTSKDTSFVNNKSQKKRFSRQVFLVTIIISLTISGLFYSYLKLNQLSPIFVSWWNKIERIFNYEDSIPLVFSEKKLENKIVKNQDWRKILKNGSWYKINEERNEKLNPEGYVYSWKDKQGNVHASNTNYPLNNNTLKVQDEINQYAKETPFRYYGNSILVQATIINRGNNSICWLLLDTGCSTTFIYTDITKNLRIKPIRKVRSVIADGRVIKLTQTKVDSFRIGPHSESNFTINTNVYNHKDKQYYQGLLGMNFLEKHPFQIDPKRKVIVWM